MQTYVVSYRNSTSNHNPSLPLRALLLLYLIEILHQTTTIKYKVCKFFALYLIEILHQTTTRRTTRSQPRSLYLIEILHQTTTKEVLGHQPHGCILSKFYIKPQPYDEVLGQISVVSYRNSTSNHNSHLITSAFLLLYLIEILHQTTTASMLPCLVVLLYLIEILHQTTTIIGLTFSTRCCILSKFYIKPQLSRQWLLVPCVVSYRNSTSNHNNSTSSFFTQRVVSYRNSTSNHNVGASGPSGGSVVSYRNSTSNHNVGPHID